MNGYFGFDRTLFGGAGRPDKDYSVEMYQRGVRSLLFMMIVSKSNTVLIGSCVLVRYKQKIECIMSKL